ncbi:FAD/NAD(P)-binding oxidoreductase [Streptomyces sp. NPDC048110]|uniref:FAD/NAD(P)-binding oxidoreductase n=1 Tax=Streptomyces sp. NPDC048110 TaxID=3155483 RepID=UPI003401F8CC
MTSEITLVAASAAGLAAVEGPPRGGYDGLLTLIGAEPHLPYDRPPLSKQLPSGAWTPQKLDPRTPETYADLRVQHMLGAEAVVATGTSARTLPGTAKPAGVHTLRTLEDPLTLRADLKSHPHLVIVGGGLVGVEAAAVARGLGCEVTLVTDQEVPLADAVGAQSGGMLCAVHQEHGVRVVHGSLVKEVITEHERAIGVRLDDGRCACMYVTLAQDPDPFREIFLSDAYEIATVTAVDGLPSRAFVTRRTGSRGTKVFGAGEHCCTGQCQTPLDVVDRFEECMNRSFMTRVLCHRAERARPAPQEQG